MPGSTRSRILVFCLLLLVLTALAAAGCEKKRIYPDTGTSAAPPPGAHATGQQAQSAPAPEPVRAAAEPEPQPVVQEENLEAEADLLRGVAEPFESGLAGFPMAGGENYDPEALVAAHRTLPLGTRVQVVSETGASVELLVADRGPFSKDVLVNVSERAARELGIGERGMVTVKVVGGEGAATAAGAVARTVAAEPVEAASATAATPATGQYYVQVGAFANRANARAVLDRVVAAGYPVSRLVSVPEEGVTKVQAGPFADRAQGQQALERLRTMYSNSFLIAPAP